MSATNEIPLSGWDDRMRSLIVKRVGPWIVSVSPMLFNDRVLLTHESQYPFVWTSGWCYDKGPAAGLAAAAWDPLTDVRPMGYKKIAAEDVRLWEAANAAWLSQEAAS